MSEANAKLAREWLDDEVERKALREQSRPFSAHRSLTDLLNQKDAEWERDVRDHCYCTRGIECAPCEILKRRGIQP